MIASTVLDDGRLYLWFGIALVVVLAVIFLVALTIRGVTKKTRQ